ncbi:hypothetical protein NA57DRAFT_75988 [Rhizodiscina lignyota]|uniref:Tautomerase cis-CaaD-like domain-containing protein n=1 Tax=Rhizodiscina lignyota TaxID=1504668 RepID=A0A9P4IBY0_9PEZI|nr:hypothetical protein NA57DRAFT_75988 [Rhizodiscina lignyota]
MPLWRIYSNSKIFTDEQKAGISEAITKLYSFLPAFYVNVIFIPLGDKDVFIGGKPTTNFVRITVEQIARTMAPSDTEEGKTRRRGWLMMINETLKPYIIDRGLDWELHIGETPRDLWTVSGIAPPPTDSEAELKWKAENKATVWE